MSLGTSFVVSLPRPWLRENSLGKGDFVFLRNKDDGSLEIQPNQSTRKKNLSIHLNIKAGENGDSIVRRVIGSYLNGYDKIKLTSEEAFTDTQQNAIREIVSPLYMLILESDSRSMTLQTLVDETRNSFLSVVERMHLITYSMLRDVKSSMNEWDEGLPKSILSLENEVDQLMFYLLRLIRLAVSNPSIAKQLSIIPVECLEYQMLVDRMERVADHTVRIAESIISIHENGFKISENVMKLLLHATKIGLNEYDEAFKEFTQNKISSANKIIHHEKEIKELFSKTISNLFNEHENHVSLYHLITIWESIIKITHYSSDIAQLAIDKTSRIKQ